MYFMKKLNIILGKVRFKYSDRNIDTFIHKLDSILAERFTFKPDF